MSNKATAPPGVFVIRRETYLTHEAVSQDKDLKPYGIHRTTVRRLANDGLVEQRPMPGSSRRKIFCKSDLFTYATNRESGFDGTYPDGRVNLAKAAADNNTTVSFLKKHLRRLRPVKQKATTIRQRGRSRTRGENTVWPRDVVDLMAELAASVRAGRQAGYMIADEIADALELVRKEDRILTAVLLKEARSIGAVPAYRPDLPIKIKGGGRRRPWLYQADAAISHLRGEHREQENVNPKHAQWQKWKAAGLSHAQIAQRHFDETDQEVTRYAVAMALLRLKLKSRTGC